MSEERLKEFEEELRGFRAVGVSREAVEGVGRALAGGRMSVGDRVLWSVMSVAGVAACFILAVGVYGVVGRSVDDGGVVARGEATVANPQMVLARVEWGR